MKEEEIQTMLKNRLMRHEDGAKCNATGGLSEMSPPAVGTGGEEARTKFRHGSHFLETGFYFLKALFKYRTTELLDLKGPWRSDTHLGMDT